MSRYWPVNCTLIGAAADLSIIPFEYKEVYKRESVIITSLYLSIMKVEGWSS